MSGKGPKGIGGQPVQCPPTLRVPCPDCGARVAERCLTFRMSGGVRVYARGHRVRAHDARVAAWRAAAK